MILPIEYTESKRGHYFNIIDIIRYRTKPDKWLKLVYCVIESFIEFMFPFFYYTTATFRHRIRTNKPVYDVKFTVSE